MRRALIYGGLAMALVIGLFWLTGALEGLSAWLRAAQRGTQDRLALAIRALRGGEPGALILFWALCFGYGVLHAAGPGHGKLLVGGYGIARRVPAGRLVGLALAASLAQAALAVALVYGLVGLLGLNRLAVEGASERWMTPFGHAMIAGLGGWLIWRGFAGLRRQGLRDASHDHEGHDHGPQCTHAHGPTLQDVQAVTGFRDALALILGIALRPCSGALFVLILTWQLGIALAGIIGAVVMGIGTALVTMAVALLAVWAREGTFAGLGGGRASRIMPWLELVVGAVIVIAALGLLVESP
jgi:nickel/cobalt transporter (NicO) family protein